MFATQEQDRIADRFERHSFKATFQGLLNPVSCPGSGLVFSLVASVLEPVPVGQYYPVPDQHSKP
jgi:hypothetical protein